jgi:hypothetical protein
VVFVADALGGWLVGQLADAGRKKLTELILGSEQERALRRAADAAVWATAEEISHSGGEEAGQVAAVISEVFGDPVPAAPLAGPVMLLEGLRAGVAGQLAVLDDAGLTGTGQSSAGVLGVPGAVLADRLTGHLVREIIVGGSGGGPLAPLADQFNHELTRLQLGGMLAQLAAEVRNALAQPGTGVTVAGRPLEEMTDPFALEVHRPVEPDVPQPELPALPVYVRRDHDAALAAVVTAAAAGANGIAVLVGGSSTGKTRACWQALELLRGLEPGWRLWHPIDPQAALAGLPGVQPRTVVWLNEAQRYLDTADGTGEQVAARLRDLQRERDRGPVLVVATLWPQFWDELTAHQPAGTDPHAQARELLVGHDIPVPSAFTDQQLRELQRAGDPRLAQAAAGSRDGQVIQYLAGAPELLGRYRNAPPAARALIDAAMDAARLGMRPALPQAFLDAAAPGYLTDTEWDLQPSDWLEEGLGYTAKPAKGVRGPLAPIRPRPSPGTAAKHGTAPAWQLADYLDQHGRRARSELIPPASFWDAAASYADPADLTTLALAAADRGLCRDAARLFKQATAHGDPRIGAYLVRWLHTVDPGNQGPADWAVAHASLDEKGAVAELVYELQKMGATSQAAALARRYGEQDTLYQAAVDDAGTMVEVLYEWRKAEAKIAGAAPPPGYRDGVGELLHQPRKPRGTRQVTRGDRDPAAHASLKDPGAVAQLLYELREVGATGQVTTLLDRDPAAHVALDDPDGVGYLLGQLREVGATGQVTTLLDRDPAAHASPYNPGAVAQLLYELHAVGATGQVSNLASRAAAGASLDNERAATGLLDALGAAGARAQAAELIERLPAAGLFGLFCRQEGREEQFWFGREADGRPARPWTWKDLG